VKLDDSAIRNMKWLEGASVETMTRVVDTLYRVHALIAAIPDLDELLEKIMDESRKVAQAEASALLLFDAKTEELYFQVALGDSGDQESLKRLVRLKLGQGIAGAAAAERKSINVADAQSDKRFFSDADATSDFHTRNLLAVPMVDHDSLIGVIEVVNKENGDAFSPLDMRVLEMFAALAASAITNARLVKEQIRTARLAAVGQAVTSLSHYTKNIVTGLRSSADLIEMGLNAGNIDILRKSFPVFRRSTNRISHFVQDMLSFSKPRVPSRESCTLKEIVDDAQETFALFFEQRKIALEIALQNEDAPLFVDRQGIYRCLLNLITNAADAVPEANGRLRIVGTVDDGFVVIESHDNGPGVPEPEYNRIFDPFYSTKGSKGTGLGLAITRKVIEEHGGNVGIEKSPDGGALFRITVPAGEAPPKDEGPFA